MRKDGNRNKTTYIYIHFIYKQQNFNQNKKTMKKLFLLTKTLLAAVLLCVGQNAWGETVGSADNSTVGSKSTTLTLNNGGTVHYEFTSTCKSGDNGNGWILVANNGSDIVRLRCDNWELVAAANTGCFSSYDWENFQSEMNGSSVSMDVSLISNVFTMSATITASNSKEYPYRYIKYLDTAPASLSICLEANYAYLNITEGTSTDSQLEIKNVVFGTQSGNAVSVEDFSTATAESATITRWTGSSSSAVVALGNITEVAKVAIGSTYSETKPSYVSGNCVELSTTSGNKDYTVHNAKYSFSAVSSGLLVFNADTYRSSDTNQNHPQEICFFDSDGNQVLKICYGNGADTSNSGSGMPLYVYNSAGTNIYSGCNSKMRTYTAFGIQGLVIDLATGNCIMTVDYTAGSAATRTVSKVAFNIGTGKNIAAVDLGRQNQNGNKGTFKTYLDNVSLYSIGTTAAEYDWTINYKVNGEGDNVKTSSGKSTTLDETINAETVFWVGAVKYVLNGSQTTSMNIVNGENVLNINVKECDTYTRNYYAVNGSGVKLQDDPIATASAYEGEKTTATWAKYLNIGGTWYSASTVGDNNVTEGGSQNVTFTASSVAYFYEIESLSRSGGSATVTETSYSYSSGSRGRISNGATLYTPALVEGVYTVSIPWENGNDGSNDIYVHTRTSGGELSAALLTFTAPKGSGTFSGVITVPDGYSIALTGNEGGYNNKARMDYITLTPLTSVSATIGSTGWTTFASPYALNLSAMTASTGDVAAYYASATSAESVTVETTASTAVQAGEGILLKGSAGATITIPVVASGSAISGNLLVGCPTATTITEATENYANIYVLGASVAEFQNVKTYIDNNTSLDIPAGKAYLDATSSNGGARALRMSFGEITGVANVEAAAEAKAQDGKFIENGKLVIVKNGQKFNAAGQQVK